MKIIGPKGTIYVKQDSGGAIIETHENTSLGYNWVEDEQGNILFKTKFGGTPGEAIQWAIDYQSSEGKAKK